jgi:acyl-CoA dehydrogenase
VAVDFSVSIEVSRLAERTAEFVRDQVIPIEDRVRGVVHDGDPEVRLCLQDAARTAGGLLSSGRA